MKRGILVAAVVMFAGAPLALAQPDVDRWGYVHSVNVYTGDLNLADPRDRDEAAWRISQATNLACAPFPDVRVLLDVRDHRACRSDAFDDAIDELHERSAHRLRRGHVTTREYPANEAPPPPPEEDDGE